MPHIILPHHYEDGAHRDFAVGDGVVAGRVPKNTAVRDPRQTPVRQTPKESRPRFPSPLPSHKRIHVSSYTLLAKNDLMPAEGGVLLFWGVGFCFRVCVGCRVFGCSSPQHWVWPFNNPARRTDLPLVEGKVIKAGGKAEETMFTARDHTPSAASPGPFIMIHS